MTLQNYKFMDDMIYNETPNICTAWKSGHGAEFDQQQTPESDLDFGLRYLTTSGERDTNTKQ